MGRPKKNAESATASVTKVKLEDKVAALLADPQTSAAMRGELEERLESIESNQAAVKTAKKQLRRLVGALT